MLKNYGIQGLPPLTRENATNRSEQISWSKSARDKVIKVYEEEFDLLGYSKAIS